MDSEKLKKYLAYYQQVLRDDPENIEARLRLASLFKDMGKRSHAVEEYISASKLLAAQGLPLEAIAACKAVLELDPTHTEVQFFLARLFAQAPGQGARVARPVEPDAPVERDDSVIALRRTKPMSPVRSDDAGAPPEEDDTSEHPLPSAGLPEHTQTYDVLPEAQRASIQAQIFGSSEMDAHTRVEISTPQELLDELRRTTEMQSTTREEQELLRETQAIDLEDIVDMVSLSAPSETEDATRVDLEPPLHYPAFDVVEDAHASPESFEVGVFDLDEMTFTQDLSVNSEHDDVDPQALLSASQEMQGVKRPGATTIRVRRQDLPDIPLFGHLSQDGFVALLRQTNVVRVQAGHVIIEPGKESLQNIYIVVKGQTVVTKSAGDEEVALAVNVEGDFFGEFGLLTGREHSARVRAVVDTTLLQVSEQAIAAVAKEDPEIWDRLWDYYHIRMLNNLMSSHGIFGKLDADAREDLVDSFVLREYVAGEQVIGHHEACHFVYLVLFGEVSLQPNGAQEVRVLREGEFFGFLPSLSDEPGGTRVCAVSDVSLLCLPAKDFRRLTRKNTGVASELRTILRARAQGKDRENLFLCGITHYAESGAYRD